ncbi:hypothetical protein AAFF_G00432530 [Aldrovandia affinis]|uniref:Uncharacterized protein n=1 Tax=Aldrovandia affinis TaxID=143900 RepID=A0AAD7S8D7_9TELE|nr:hypothetical protein AAFF_G00432530 [Aldrovandia affinis]
MTRSKITADRYLAKPLPDGSVSDPSLTSGQQPVRRVKRAGSMAQPNFNSFPHSRQVTEDAVPPSSTTEATATTSHS